MEFENLQIEVPVQEEESQLYGIKIYEFLQRKANRAKRFGIEKEAVEKETALDLNAFSDIDLEKLEWPPVTEEALEEMRNDAILLHGVNNMSTKDVFDYFKLFGPETLEWIDDCSCNVVWDDEVSMLRAMDGMSKTYAMLKTYKSNSKDNTIQDDVAPPVTIKEEVEEDEAASDAIEIEDDEIDPKDVWRIGLPYKSQYNLFLRPATIKDKKLPGAAQRSEYYLKYGKNPNNTDRAAGILSKSRKRKLQQMKKLADQRFRSKEPDVKICDLADLKEEGLVQKMEVDDDGPAGKKPHLNHVRPNPMTMIADKEEISQRLGNQRSDSVHDRLGRPVVSPHANPERSLGDIRDRLGVSIHERLGKRTDVDARDEIRSSRRRNNNDKTRNRYNYEDEAGVYHDVYRADHLKEEEEDDGKENITRYNDDSEEDEGSDARFRSRRDNHGRNDRTLTKTKSRLGTSGGNNATPDLRDKLRGNNKKGSRNNKTVHNREKNIKEENTDDKVNLCIEIKPEPDDVDMLDDDNFEF
ncbi:nuclear speckle splicing regulatory protein 1-like isoform X2 [Hydractinia symbiolongicarpus]|uniref:nuclear speckle splicing regulatory protein 1-like isoform X2 n=1 Tax=Hydractinia symbiolongicarpus TaxID=13093 RepID=UPI00254D5469|nr:nuclear speckle splicing regulatory protein 1-like isoform X2 [Hydractinia symbiolongicarpus]